MAPPVSPSFYNQSLAPPRTGKKQAPISPTSTGSPPRDQHQRLEHFLHHNYGVLPEDDDAKNRSMDDHSLAAKDSLALVEEGPAGILVLDEFNTANPYHVRRRRRRRMGMGFGLFLLAALAGVLVFLLTSSHLTRQDDQGGVDGVEGENEQGDDVLPLVPSTAAPSFALSPSPAPSSSLELTLAYHLLYPHVSNPDNLLDPKTPQGKAFLTILDESDPHYMMQRFALMTIYFSTYGNQWKRKWGWQDYPRIEMVGQKECDWPGVVDCVDIGDNRLAVTGLDFSNNYLAGKWPAEACLLDRLQTLDLKGNYLSHVSTCLAGLPLTRLELDENPLNAGIDKLCSRTDWPYLTADCTLECPCCTNDCPTDIFRHNKDGSNDDP